MVSCNVNPYVNKSIQHNAPHDAPRVLFVITIIIHSVYVVRLQMLSNTPLTHVECQCSFDDMFIVIVRASLRVETSHSSWMLVFISTGGLRLSISKVVARHFTPVSWGKAISSLTHTFIHGI